MHMLEALVTVGVQEQEKADTPYLKKKLERSKTTLRTMWDLDAKLKADGLIGKKQALSFFCPVYFEGQKIVKLLLNKIDEQGERMLFPLPTITNPDRVKFGIEEMRRMGIPSPEKLLDKKTGGLKIYSSLPGVEGIGSENEYPFIGSEFVYFGAFQIVPMTWLNGGDPVNESYRFPGETGYSPYWRVPTFEEFKKMRPDLAKSYKQNPDGTIKKTK